MKLCKKDCPFQSDGICYREKICPSGNGSSKCVAFLRRSKNGGNGFSYVFTKNKLG